LKTWNLYIDGSWQTGVDGITVPDVDPSTGKPFAEVTQGSAADVDRAVESAHAAHLAWRRTTPSEREALLLEVARITERRQSDIADMLVTESGCSVGTAMYQIGYSIESLKSAAGECRRIVGETIPSDVPGLWSMTVREPLGVIAGIAPFNVPFVLAMNKVDKAVAAGNGFVLKPAEQTPISGLIIGEIFTEAGAPDGLVNVITGGAEAGEALVKHPSVKMICFTGSTRTGRAIAEAAGRALKKVCLEMGGKSPLLVLADSDLDYATATASFGIFNHQGQVCMASSRVIVEAPLYEPFCTALAARAAALKVGKPTEPDTVIGPLIEAAHCERIAALITEAEAAGARVMTGNHYEGAYFSPTVVADVTPAMSVFEEELFGPVVCISKADDTDHAIELANTGRYGLSSAVMTRDLDRALKCARELDAGAVHVNATTIQCEPNIPFGGTKESSVGREGGRYSIEEMTELKWITFQQGERAYPF